MMKIIASLIILGLCVNVCSGAAAVATTQSISSSSLNSTATKVYSAANTTDQAVWNQYATATIPTTPQAVPAANVVFGPGTENTTSYVYGLIPTTASNQITKIVKRTLNNTIVGWGNDTAMAAVTKTDDSVTTTIPAASGTSFTTAVAPGYLAILSTGPDGSTAPFNQQAYLNLFSGTTASQTKLTSITDMIAANVAVNGQCTTTTLGVGNIWYDIGAGAFFYTYWKKVVSEVGAAAAGTCGGGTTPAASTVHTIYLGGHYVNGTAYWAAPGLALTPTATANTVSNLYGGGDNWLNATNIYVVYKDTGMSAPQSSYVAKTTKATTTTAGGSFSALVADVTGATGVYDKTFTPIGVWTSNYTYGVAVYNKTATAAGAVVAGTTTYTYTIGNYLNGTTTYTDSGISYSSATSASALVGWPLTTGYTLVGGFGSTATGTTYVMGTFYANGTVNSTQATLGTLQGAVSYYMDKNGTMWTGWQDVDAANTPVATYAGYLAKLQGQINVASGANVLTTLLAFVALFFAAIFAF